MTSRRLCCLVLLGLNALSPLLAAPVDTNTRREFQVPESLAEWEQKAADIRLQAVVSCGLYGIERRRPLNFRIFDRVERDGYSVEKVWIETYPGFYLGGNLYRPLNQGRGPFPAILNPHGHWAEGRLADKPEGSNPARCIHFVRNGMIAFAYDMVGYHDTRFADVPAGMSLYQAHRSFGNDPRDWLWNISLMGLQTWNSIRALDFLEQLPEVDRKRLACTGESGGATQTFMLGAVDSRLAAQAPVVMVSHIMQGGCSCENVSGLRVDFFNVDIAAAAAPRPQLMVSATGDWTRHAMEVEGPAIAEVYKLFGAQDRFGFVRFDFGHNYNQTSREAVYAFMGRHLLRKSNPDIAAERSYQVEKDLRVFPGNLPAGAVTQEELSTHLRQERSNWWAATLPSRSSRLKGYREHWLPAWRRTLQVDWPMPQPTVQQGASRMASGLRVSEIKLTPGFSQESRTLRHWSKDGKAKSWIVVAPADSAEGPSPLTRRLAEAGLSVMEYSRLEVPPANLFTNFFTTYNRTPAQLRVRDWLAISSACKLVHPKARILLVGGPEDGPLGLLAAPGFDAFALDVNGLVPGDEQALIAPDYFVPGLLALGGFEGVALLGNPHLLLHNAQGQWSLPHLRRYLPMEVRESALSVEELANQVMALTKKNP